MSPLARISLELLSLLGCMLPNSRMLNKSLLDQSISVKNFNREDMQCWEGGVPEEGSVAPSPSPIPRPVNLFRLAPEVYPFITYPLSP